jgi:hypothetical protein
MVGGYLPHITNSSLVDLQCTRGSFAKHNRFSTVRCLGNIAASFFPADVTGACNVVGVCARLPQFITAPGFMQWNRWALSHISLK